MKIKSISNHFMIPRIPVILFLLISFSSNSAQEGSKFVRFIEGDNEWQGELQTAIVSFENSEGVRLDLVAAVHLGELEYYAALNDYFVQQDVVLYELVAEANQIPSKDKQNSGSSVVGTIQQALANFLNVGFQLNEIDYAMDNFLHADLTPGQLDELMASKNENFFTMFLNLALAQIADQQANPNNESLSGFNILSLLNALNAEDQNNAFKYLFAQELGRSGGVMVGAELEQQLTILGDRNQVALRVLRETLRTSDYHTISIFYGAAHMPGIEREISNELGFKKTGLRWQSAWIVP